MPTFCIFCLAIVADAGADGLTADFANDTPNFAIVADASADGLTADFAYTTHGLTADFANDTPDFELIF